jgi:uncharacterized membrane protein YsdA (DUF1294 family)
MAKTMRPDVFHGLVALALVAAGASAFLAAGRFPLTWYHLLAGWLLSINLCTFGYYGFDKGRAGSQGRRVPEVVLHGLAFLGGTLGAYLGMRLFRHKTVKSSFRLVFWWLAALQVMLVVAVAYRLWTHRAT